MKNTYKSFDVLVLRHLHRLFANSRPVLLHYVLKQKRLRRIQSASRDCLLALYRLGKYGDGRRTRKHIRQLNKKLRRT